MASKICKQRLQYENEELKKQIEDYTLLLNKNMNFEKKLNLDVEMYKETINDLNKDINIKNKNILEYNFKYSNLNTEYNELINNQIKNDIK